MARQLYIGTHGSEDPTKATLPFLVTSGALDAGGHEPAVLLLGDSVVLMNDTVAENVHGVGIAPLKELVGKAVENRVPIFV